MRAQRIPLRRDGEVRVPLLGGPSRAAAAAVVQGEARRCCSIGAWAFRTVVALALVLWLGVHAGPRGLIPHEQVDALQLELRKQRAQISHAAERLRTLQTQARAPADSTLHPASPRR